MNYRFPRRLSAILEKGETVVTAMPGANLSPGFQPFRSLTTTELFGELEKEISETVDKNGFFLLTEYLSILTHTFDRTINLYERTVNGRSVRYHLFGESHGPVREARELQSRTSVLPSLNQLYRDAITLMQSRLNERHGYPFSNLFLYGVSDSLFCRALWEDTGLTPESTYITEWDSVMLHDLQNSFPEIRMDTEPRSAESLAALSRENTLIVSGPYAMQRLGHYEMERTIAKLGKVMAKGSVFAGFFSTPDVCRTMPEFLRSHDALAFRRKEMTEHRGAMGINIQSYFAGIVDNTFRIYRQNDLSLYLPSLWKLRYFFTRLIGPVEIYDMGSLLPMKTRADTTPSGEFLLLARKD